MTSALLKSWLILAAVLCDIWCNAIASAAPEPVELRREIDAALSGVLPKTVGERRQQAERLLPLYMRCQSEKRICSADRARLQVRLKSRLTRLADALRRDSLAERRRSGLATNDKSPTTDNPPVAHKSPGTDQSPGTDNGSVGSQAAAQMAAGAAAGAAGGAPQDEGQALIELIEATIAPQSWEVNGGPGTIRYWPAWHVLVVRQTDDVHEQLGGAMHALRP